MKFDLVKLEDVYDEKMINLMKEQDKMFNLRELFANLVAYIYKNVNWKKIASGKEIAPNIFQHRMFFASKENTIEIFIERLCSSLSIQSPLIPMEIIHGIMIYKNHMNYLREQTRIFTAYAMKLSKVLKMKIKTKNQEKKRI